MGKTVSKIVPKTNPARTLQSANNNVSRKVLYRKLQGHQPSYHSYGTFDFIAASWPTVLYVLVYSIYYLRFEDEIMDLEKLMKSEKSCYELIKENIYKNELRDQLKEETAKKT